MCKDGMYSGVGISMLLRCENVMFQCTEYHVSVHCLNHHLHHLPHLPPPPHTSRCGFICTPIKTILNNINVRVSARCPSIESRVAPRVLYILGILPLPPCEVFHAETHRRIPETHSKGFSIHVQCVSYELRVTRYGVRSQCDGIRSRQCEHVSRVSTDTE